MRAEITAVGLALALAACPKKSAEPGFEERAPDGGTLLEVDVDCSSGPIWLDGRPWSAPRGVPAPVQPGRHHLGCGVQPDAGVGVDIDVHDGRLFHFQFWGLGQ